MNAVPRAWSCYHDWPWLSAFDGLPASTLPVSLHMFLVCDCYSSVQKDGEYFDKILPWASCSFVDWPRCSAFDGLSTLPVPLPASYIRLFEIPPEEMEDILIKHSLVFAPVQLIGSLLGL